MDKVDTAHIASIDIEKAKNFKIASKYLLPWINGRNFLFGGSSKFYPYKKE